MNDDTLAGIRYNRTMAALGTDPLSPLAHDIIAAGTYEKLTVTGPAPPTAIEILAGVTPDQLLTVSVNSYAHAAAMLGGLWLWHDALNESHEIAQQSPEKLHRSAPFPHQTPSKMSQMVQSVESVENAKVPNPQRLRDANESLAFWHAIMHRREGDFSNSKYWYARCRNHPALAAIASRATPLLATLADRTLAGRLARGGWDTDAFVDWVEEVADGSDPASRDLAVKLQRIEWQGLFDHCLHEAAGR